MVAATVTALVTGSTVGILRTVLGAQKRVDRQAAGQQEARVAIEAIATALRNANRFGAGDEAVLEGIDAWTDKMPADRIRFFTISHGPVRWDQPESDVRECEFVLGRPNPDAPPVLMRRTDPTRNPKPDDGGVIEVVAENVVAMNLTYHDGVDWRRDWPRKRKGWPLAIRISLAVLEGGSADETRDDANVRTITRIVNFPGSPPRLQQNEK